MYRAQYVDVDQRIAAVYRQALQRLTSSPWQPFSHDLLNFRSVGFSVEAFFLEVLSDATRVRASSASSAYAVKVAALDTAELDEGSMLSHPLGFWLPHTVLRGTQRFRQRVRGGGRHVPQWVVHRKAVWSASTGLPLSMRRGGVGLFGALLVLRSRRGDGARPLAVAASGGSRGWGRRALTAQA